MKKLSSVLVAVLFVVVVVSIVMLMSRSKTCGMVKAEVGAIVEKVHVTQRIGSDLSPDLRKVINKDPKYVLVCLVIEEAKRGWPGISQEDASRIIDKAVRSSDVALEDLQEVLRRNAKKAIADAGKDSSKENWDNNNTATAILYCYWPKAVEKGRQSQFVEEYLCGARDSWTSWMFN